MENTKSPWESDGNRSMRKSPFLWLRAHAKFVTGGRLYFLVGRHDGRRKKSSSVDSSVAGYSASIPAWGQRRATGQEDAGVEGDVGRSIWKELPQGRRPPGEVRGCCPPPAQPRGRSWCSRSPLLLCSPARTKRRSFALLQLTVSTSPGLFTATAFYTSSLTQSKANSALERLWLTGLLWSAGWVGSPGGDTGRLSLQTRMRCPLLPPLPGEWVTSASPTLCGGALRLLQFFKKAF